MAPATMTEPNNVSNDESTSRQRSVPTSLVFENSLVRENSSDVSNNDQGRGIENDGNEDDSTGTCTPRTPIPNPLKTFRFVCN